MLRLILLLAGCAMAQQVYTNADFNAKYTAPAGWVFDAPTISSDGFVVIKPNRVGLNPSRCEISFFFHSTLREAFHYPSSNGFFQANEFMKVTRTISTQAPIIFNIRDTAETDVHYCYLLIKQVDAGVISAYFSASNRLYSQTFKIVTTIADWNTNESLYMANWSETEFISLRAPTAAKLSTIRPPKSNMRMDMVDILGRESIGAITEKTSYRR